MTAKKYFLFLPLLLLVVIFFAGCAGSGGSGGAGNLIGTIYDVSYEAISNVNVVMSYSSTLSQSDGTYTFNSLSAGPKMIVMSTPLYTPAYRSANVVKASTVRVDPAFMAPIDTKVTHLTAATGGNASNTTDRIKMFFPAGSLPLDTDLILTSVPKIAAPINAPAGQQFISYILYAKPDNITLATPARLSVPNLTGTTDATFYHFNVNTYSWDLLPGKGTASAETNTIDFKTSVLGWIAAIIPITPRSETISGIVRNGSSIGPVVSGANVWTENSYTASDSLGNYTLTDVPPGNTAIYASAIGYALFQDTVNVIDSPTATIKNIVLAPLSSSLGNIAGFVGSRSIPFQPISGARVSASDMGNVMFTYTDQNGAYTLYGLRVGVPIQVMAVAAHYAGSIEAVTISTPGSTVNADTFKLPFISSTYPSIYYDFSYGAQGFTATSYSPASAVYGDLWNLTSVNSDTTQNTQDLYNTVQASQTRKVKLPMFNATVADDRLPAKHDGSSGSYFWCGQYLPVTGEGSYIGVQFDTDIRTTESFTGGISNTDYMSQVNDLFMPVVDLSGYLNATLSFWTWWEIEGKAPATGYDIMDISVSTNPNDLTPIWTSLGHLNPVDDPIQSPASSNESYTSGGYNTPGQWVQHNIDISQFVGKKIQVRFEFDAGDNKYNGYRGWIIDDVGISFEAIGTQSTDKVVILGGKKTRVINNGLSHHAPGIPRN
jgi:Carboxypeptidase regulatory-like domain